jgi:beta-phosphoglucomutase
MSFFHFCMLLSAQRIHMAPIKAHILNAFKGFIFDIDGTIIDSMKIHLKAWQKTLENYGCSLSLKEVGEKAYGINPEIVKRTLGNHLSDQEIEKISNEKEILFRSSFDPEEDVIRGFMEFIAELRKNNLPMVIGSAAPPENIDYFMERLQIRHFFEDFISEDDVTKGKPSPEVFIKAANAIGIDIKECVVFEDSPSGAEASAKAGSKTIAVLSTKSKSDFKEVPNVIEFIKDYTQLLED